VLNYSLLLLSITMKFWLVRVIPKYLNFPAFWNGLLTMFKLWFCPAFWSRDMTTCFHTERLIMSNNPLCFIYRHFILSPNKQT
jgi:hypothetical protein